MRITKLALHPITKEEALRLANEDHSEQKRKGWATNHIPGSTIALLPTVQAVFIPLSDQLPVLPDQFGVLI